MLRFIVSIILIHSVLCATGQTDTARVRPPKPPKVKKELKEFIPTGVRLGADLNSFTRQLWDDSKKFQEVQLDIDFRHYLLVLEYGRATIDEMEADFSYFSEGSYFRIGPEINFIYEPDKQDAIFVGLRYATSSYDDQLTFNTEDAFGNAQITASNAGGKGQWAEMTAGTKISLWKGLSIGFTVRYKFLKSIEFDELEPHWIPGFGENREDDNDQFGFSYYISWRFGIRKAHRTQSPVIPDQGVDE